MRAGCNLTIVPDLSSRDMIEQVAIFQARLKQYGMNCPMCRKGVCRANSPAKNRFNSFNSGRVHGLRYETRTEKAAMSFE